MAAPDAAAIAPPVAAPDAATVAPPVAAAVAAAQLPPRIAGDWTDSRVPVTELYYPPLDLTAVGRQSAQAPRAAGQFVRGVANTTAITYGNRRAEVVAFLNSKDPTPPPATRMADRRLVNVGRTMANTLVYIIECLHYLLVSSISERILTNRTICGKNSRPDPHVNTAKVQMAAQVIKVLTFGLDTCVDCLFQCKGRFSSPDSVLFSEYAIEFIVTRLSSVEYKFQPSSHELRSANWDNFGKAISRRCRHGIWSNEYVERLIARRRVKKADATIVKGVFAPVAIYCTKLIPNFRSLLNNKPHYMHHSEYVGDAWNRLVGEAMYAADEDYDSDNTI